MTKGNVIYEQIKDKISQESKIIDELEHKHSRMSGECEKLEEQRQEQYIKLAEFYLPSIEDLESLKSGLQGIRTEISALSKARNERRDTLAELISQSEKRRQNLQEKLSGVVKNLNEKEDEIEKTEAKIAGELGKDPKYTELKSEAESLKERMKIDDEKARNFTDEANRKRIAYEKDRTFMYLLKRGFGSDQYTGGAVFGFFDNVVAKIVKFEKNKNNYDILVNMPKKLINHLKQIDGSLQEIDQQLEEREEKCAEDNGLFALVEAHTLMSKTKEDYDASIVKTNEEHLRHVKEREQLDGRDDDTYYRQAIRKITTILEGKSIQELKTNASRTPNPSDDGIVQKIESADLRISELNEQLATLQANREQYSERLQRLKKIESYFTEKNYQGSRSRFSSSFDINHLLKDLLSGENTIIKVKDAIDKNQHFEKPPQTYSYSSSSSRSSSGFGSISRSSGGGFSSSSRSSGGGFGGGGRSSGGGFGGGGRSSGGGF